jgi:hypothetical protein
VSEELELEWDAVPPVVVDRARVLDETARAGERLPGQTGWPDKLGDEQDELRWTMGASHKAERAATDLRAFSAMVHSFHNSRLVISPPFSPRSRGVARASAHEMLSCDSAGAEDWNAHRTATEGRLERG